MLPTNRNRPVGHKHFILIMLTMFAGQVGFANGQNSLDHIIKNYVIISDFSVKEETRKNSEEIFWKYPIKVEDAFFPIIYDFSDPLKEMPPTPGGGRVYEHLNLGRALFLDGKYEEAKKVWLSARQNFGKNYPHHRRADYYIANAFLRIGQALGLEKGFDDLSTKTNLANAATFLSFGYMIKRDEPDDVLEVVAPKQFYNLAAIYFFYQRYVAAYGAAGAGLDFLRKTGRSEYRADFHRILAEAHIKNQTYLEAVQELDVALRQDPTVMQASAIFSRIGDIYFALNNYELAEEMYDHSAKILNDAKLVDPYQHVLRGESLFWVGRFQDSEREFAQAIAGAADKGALRNLSPAYYEFARLRYVDALLAQRQLEKAKLEYFKIDQDIRKGIASVVSRLRRACLELPEYDGKNVKHARKQLRILLEDPNLSREGIELAESCYTASFVERERSEDMVEKVRDFAAKYPRSKFLASMIPAVKEVRAGYIDELFARGRTYAAIDYFQKKRHVFYKEVSDELASKLFEAYFVTENNKAAIEFYPRWAKQDLDDLGKLRRAVFISEGIDKKDWSKSDLKYLSQDLPKHKWSIDLSPKVEVLLSRIRGSDVASTSDAWIYNLRSSWFEKNSKTYCGGLFPMQTRIWKRVSNSVRDKIKSDFIKARDEFFPKILETDEACAISMLEFEQDFYQYDKNHLVDLYLKRRDWKMTPTLTAVTFGVAERLLSENLKKEAEGLFKHIVSKSPPKSPEVSFAKTRLQALETTYGGTWR